MHLHSVLSVFWRRSKKTKQTSASEVPDVALASSGDDQLSPAASMEAATANTDSVSTPPPTPPALKPRASIHEIRHQLGIPNLLPLSTAEVSMTAGGLPVLPPRVQIPVSFSPQVSNASFYSKSSSHSCDRVAASPNLAAPTTAVGALFSHSQSLSKSVSFFRDDVHEDRYQPVLPPRRKWCSEEYVDEVQYQRLEDHMDQNMDHDDQSSFDNTQWMSQSDTSFSSHAGLIDEKPRRYNFDPIMQLNVSAISGNMTDQSSLERDDDEQGSMLLTRKRWNQQSHKEKLVLDCIERLMENVPLLQALDTIGADKSLSLHGEGLLEGFAERKQGQIQQHLKAILRELDTAKPEEFFMSPSQLEEYGESHSELRRAFEFVLKVLCLEPMDAWELKYEVQVSSGLVALPDSPSETIRGGDTSLFTLPEESNTPHASNFSIATTITSKPMSPKKVESTFRQTLEVLGALLQKLSLACQNLANPKVTTQNTIRATEEIKQIYLSIMTIQNCDLMVVVDAFYLAMPLIRTVSLERDDECAPALETHVELQSKEPIRLDLLPTFEDHAHRNDANHMTMEYVQQDNDDHDDHDNKENTPDDDLRRIVGSNDYDCDDTRDDAPCDDDEREVYHDFYCTAQVSHGTCKT